MNQLPQRRMPFGAETDELGGTCFRLWAPAARIGSQPARAPQRMTPLADGWFEPPLADVGARTRYHRWRTAGAGSGVACATRRHSRDERATVILRANLGPEPLTPAPEMPQGLPIFTIHWSIMGESVHHDWLGWSVA